MRMKLSDHDEWALFRCSQFCGPVSAVGPRLTMSNVAIHGGWACGTDGYRMLMLPVETHATGVVFGPDAAAGGTVVARKSNHPFLDHTQFVPSRLWAEGCTGSPAVAEALRPWAKKRPPKPNQSPKTSVAWAVPAGVMGSRSLLVTPDGERAYDIGPQPVAVGFVAQWVAHAAMVIGEAQSDGHVAVMLPSEVHLPVVIAGDDRWDGVAIVMTVASICPAPRPWAVAS